MNEIIRTMINHVRYNLKNSRFRAKHIVYDNDNMSINFVLVKSQNHIYKIFVRYNYGQDLYEICFMKMYVGSKINRPDWYVPYFTQWETGIFVDMLRDMIEGFYFNRHKHTYYTLEEIS